MKLGFKCIVAKIILLQVIVRLAVYLVHIHLFVQAQLKTTDLQNPAVQIQSEEE